MLLLSSRWDRDEDEKNSSNPPIEPLLLLLFIFSGNLANGVVERIGGIDELYGVLLVLLLLLLGDLFCLLYFPDKVDTIPLAILALVDANFIEDEVVVVLVLGEVGDNNEE